MAETCTPTSTFERQAELLERIHADARELRELAGDALVITIEPAKKAKAATKKPSENGTGRGSTNRAIGERNRAEVRAVFEAAPGVWLAPRDVVERTSLTAQPAGKQIRRLLEEGVLEHNGRLRNAVRYRLLVAEPVDEAPPGSGELEQPPAASNGHDLSARTRKSVARAALEVEAAGQPQDELPELDARVHASVGDDAATVTELSMRLDVPRRDIALAIDRLSVAGHVVKCGVRPPRQHTVYGTAE